MAWAKWESKFELLTQPLRSLADDELILVVDGQDTAFLPCLRSLVDSFSVYNASLVFQATRFQQPDKGLMARPLPCSLLCCRLTAELVLAAASLSRAAQAYHSPALPHRDGVSCCL